MQRLPCYAVTFFLILALLVPGSAFASDKSELKSLNIRGVEQYETRVSDPIRYFGSGLLYVPRQVLDGLMYGTGIAAEKLSDKEFIRKVKDVLYLYEEKLLWFPIVGYASGFRPTYGAGLFYNDKGYKSLFRYTMYDAHYWSMSWKNTYTKDIGWASWTNSLLAVTETKNDRRFYGIGAKPRHDERNLFIAENDYGIYTEDRRKLQWESKLQNPDGTYGLNYLGYLQRKDFKSHGTGNNDMEDIFDVARIPGFQHPVSQIYNELSFEFDTRDKKKILSPGFYFETYGGFSNGIGKNPSDLFRTGIDVAGFIPVVKQDRLIVPRLVLDMVENLDNEPIPFSEYPRQLSFRGTSGREMIRSDRVSMVPSIEYQWPLSHMFSGHIFFDTLIVGPRVSDMSWHNALWATGVGFDFHLLEREFARFEMAIGSEGFQATLTFGVPLKSNHRKDW